MTRNLKAVFTCVVALLALGALGAQAAHAATPEFHCTTTKTANCQLTSSGPLGGSNDHEIKFNVGTLECVGNEGTNGALFPGTMARTSTTMSLNATYVGCTLAGVKATVKMEECKYVFHLIEGGASPYPSLTDVSCPAGKQITISALACTVTIGAQTELLGSKFENEGEEPTHVKIKTEVSGIEYTEGATCPKGGGKFANGVYKGTTTETGFEDEEVGGGEKKEGQKVGLHVF